MTKFFATRSIMASIQRLRNCGANPKVVRAGVSYNDGKYWPYVLIDSDLVFADNNEDCGLMLVRAEKDLPRFAAQDEDFVSALKAEIVRCIG